MPHIVCHSHLSSSLSVSPLQAVVVSTGEPSLPSAVLLLAIELRQLGSVPAVRLPGRRRIVRRAATAGGVESDADPHHEPDVRVVGTAVASSATRREAVVVSADVVAVGVPRAAAAEDGGLLALGLAVAVEVGLERGDVGLEAERGHGPEQVVAVDGLALLALALVGGLPRDEADELRHALLHRLLGLLGDLGVRGQRLLHDARHVRDRQEPVLLLGRRVVVRRRAAHWAQQVAALLALHMSTQQHNTTQWLADR
jgi:hypothetical protein